MRGGAFMSIVYLVLQWGKNRQSPDVIAHVEGYP